MDRGLIGKARGFPLEGQRAVLEAAGVPVIYDDPSEVIASLRAGDRLVIGGPLHILASSRDGIRVLVADVKARGCDVYDLVHGEDTRGTGLEAFGRAYDATNPAHRFQDASKMGAEGARKRWKGHKPKGLPVGEAKRIWKDLSIIDNAEALERMGWSQTRAYKKFGKSGRTSGPRPKSDQ